MFAAVQSMTFDNANSALDEGLRAIASGGTSFDLSGVAAVDSSAIAVMLAWQREALAKSITLSFTNPPANLSRLAKLYGVADLLQLTSSGNSRADLPHH